ncbi:polysaccharide pyruvyl transferase family protein [Terrisporobacter glycolicus]|nr:polysaccharide pyruvyl transferase family protein [Terrisporobacter glycolicus]
MNIMMMLHSGSLNRGCEAIVRSGVRVIKNKIPNSNIYLNSFRPDTDKHLDFVNEVYDGSNLEIKKYSIPWFISCFKIKLFKDESYAFRKRHNNIIKYIDNNDIILSIGGDAYCYGEQPAYYEIDRVVKSKGKKLVLWGCSIGEEDLTSDKIEDLKNFDLILARESITYNTLKSKGLNNTKLCADGAFTMEKEELELPKGWAVNNTIGINFSPLVLKRNSRSEQSIKDLIQYILEKTDMTICLTTHVTEKGNSDYEVLLKYHNEFKSSKRVIILPDNLNAVQYKGYIGRMRFFIGARTHATIAAYSNCVPTMVLGYSVKSKGIANDIFGEEKLVLGIDEISDSNILKSKFNEMFTEEKEIKEMLEKSIPKIKRMSYKAGEYLAELACK